jgi:hypothetical protein
MQYIRRYITDPCPCCSDGSLAFYACPACGYTLLVCDTAGTVYTDPRTLRQAIPGRSADPEYTCPRCENVPVSEFRPASPEQIAATGVKPDEYE